MLFSEFEIQIVNVAKMELPGEQFHLKMAPIERLLELKRKARDLDSAKKAAVLVLFYPSAQGETQLILILRKTYKGVHSAQVGFPRGKLEPEDANMQAAALREAEDEVGVPRDRPKVLKELTEIYIPPSNFFVQPYLAMVDHRPDFVKQDEEVEALIEVPLAELMNLDNRITQRLMTSYAVEIDVPAFQLQGHVVWGATAMMLNEVHEIVRRLT